MFADDYILFEKAVDREVATLMEGLKEYKECLSQYINFEKSLLFFCSNCSNQKKDMISQSFRVRYSAKPKAYLGLLNMVGKGKNAFQNLKDRLSNRIHNWCIRPLS